MKRTGKKCTSSHTTVIESSAEIVDFGNSCELVKKITLGIIKPIPHSRGGPLKRIKCIQEAACLLLKIRGNRAIQEIRLFSDDIKSLEKKVCEYAKSIGFEIS
jgi:hypothetical protein